MNIFVVFHHERCSAAEARAGSPRARKGAELSSAFGVPSRAVRQVVEMSNRVFEKWGDSARSDYARRRNAATRSGTVFPGKRSRPSLLSRTLNRSRSNGP